MMHIACGKKNVLHETYNTDQCLWELKRNVQMRMQSILRDSFKVVACQSYLACSSKQVGMISISRVIIWYA